MQKTTLAPIFTNHAVLQRNKPLHFWGTCSGKSSLQIIILKDSDYSATLTTGQTIPSTFPDPVCLYSFSSSDSTFHVTLPPQNTSETLCVLLAENHIICTILHDVVMGEVWLAGGQSNMEYELQNDADAASLFQKENDCQCSDDNSNKSSSSDSIQHGELKGSVAGNSPSQFSATQDACAQVRFYQVPRQAFFCDAFYEAENSSTWMTTASSGFGSWSAVAYHFASELSQKLNCPVGIIGCNWGGTSASAWQDRQSLLSHPETAIYWEEYADILNRQTPEEYEKAREDYLLYQEQWQPKINEFYAQNPSGTWEEALSYAGPCQWPGPMGPKHEFRPAGLYETMLRRITPYTLQGFLYYQGESDDHHPECYETLLQSMLQVWRRDFEDEALYFMNVQLPMHRYANDPVSDSWAKIREAQYRLSRKDSRSGLAVLIDQGEYNNIHPVHKQEAGHRLCLQALFRVYRQLTEQEACGPFAASATLLSENRQILIQFRNCETGFDLDRYREISDTDHSSPASALISFEVMDANNFWHSAIAVPDGNGTVLINVPETVLQPKAVRYLWTNYSMIPLYDHRGFPAAPFLLQL